MTAPAPRTELERLERWAAALDAMATDMAGARYGFLANDVRTVAELVRMQAAPFRMTQRAQAAIGRFVQRVVKR